MKKKLAFKVENELRRKQHESQTSKEDPKKVARRLRAQKRRDKQATADALAARPPRKLPKRVEKKEIRRKPPTVVPSRVSEPEEDTCLTLSQLNGMISPKLSFVKFCDHHYQILLHHLKRQEILPWLAIDVPDLHDKLKNKEIEPLFHSFDGLIRLATKAIGIEALRTFQCPVCAFQKHDYLGQVAEAMKQIIIEKAESK